MQLKPDLFEPNINPAFGPAMGGTVITMKGSNICIGNRRISAYVVDDNKRIHVMDQCLCLKGLSGTDNLTCTMTKADKEPGNDLNLVAGTSDYKITIGIEDCKMIEVNKNYMTCAAPRNQPKGSQPGQLPEVNVKVGNINMSLGYIQYQQELNIILIIAGASGGAAVFLLVMGTPKLKHFFEDLPTIVTCPDEKKNICIKDVYRSMSDELRARARTGMERFQGNDSRRPVNLPRDQMSAVEQEIV
ncbi:hypothetical protein MAR_011669 [Mya arenaria]|uniref:IPT/TIG domain-containing protein n=1 Tax=Mya arenaria TaxID=6604 RepID=A0ABY7FVG1_MYAAR|nr:hypothetical protein MAR_011669 [Mya arenaria]